MENTNKEKIKTNIKDSIEIKTIVVYDTVKVENKIDIGKEKNNITFKIQIAASKKPLSIEKLNKICIVDDIIHSEYFDNWYKYHIGFYKTYNKAQEYKLILGLKDAFIVAYKNGKRINASEFKRYVKKNN